MIWLRSLLWYICLLISLLIFGGFLFLTVFKGRGFSMRVQNAWSRAIGACTRIVCGIRYQIEGVEHLANPPAVLLSKHQSTWETFIFPGILPLCCFVCKKSLLNIPIFGWGMRFAGHIPIDRAAGSKSFKAVIREGKERLSAGISIVIFPEGTRVSPGLHPNFHKSGIALAKTTGYPLIPIAHNAGSFWPRRGFLKYPGTITVVIGPPLECANQSLDELTESLYQWTRQTMERIQPIDATTTL